MHAIEVSSLFPKVGYCEHDLHTRSVPRLTMLIAISRVSGGRQHWRRDSMRAIVLSTVELPPKLILREQASRWCQSIVQRLDDD